MKQRKRTGRSRAGTKSKPPKALRGHVRAKGNPLLDRQTRKVLGRHYAARYRVR